MPILLLLALFSPLLAHSKLIDRVVAVVSDQPILHSDVEQLLTQFRRTPNLANFYGVKKNAVNYEGIKELLLNEAIIRHSLKELNSSISDGDVQKQINSIASQNKMSVERLKESLSREGIAFDSYKQNIRMQLEKKALFDRELRGSSSNVSEAELRADFEKIAKKQWNLKLWAEPSTADVKDTMNSSLRDFRAQKISLKELSSKHAFNDLGWVDLSSLNPTFQKALKDKGPRSATDTILLNNTLHIIFVENVRKGTDDQFQAAKDQLLRQRQGENLDEVFKSWIERKKKEIQVVINK